MDTKRIPKQALQYKPKGRRNIGLPRKRWRDQFHFEVKEKQTRLIFQEYDDDDDDDDDDVYDEILTSSTLRKKSICKRVENAQAHILILLLWQVMWVRVCQTKKRN
jgi:hypothetical protein